MARRKHLAWPAALYDQGTIRLGAATGRAGTRGTCGVPALPRPEHRRLDWVAPGQYQGADVQPNQRLRHHRLQRGWTQENVAEELAALAPNLGEKQLPVTGRMVGKWERGEATPKGA